MIVNLILLTLTILISIKFWWLPIYRYRKNTKDYIKEYTSLDSKLEHCYTAQFKGESYKFYKFKNVLDLPPKRAIAAEVATKMANLCLTEKMYDDYLMRIKKALNKSDMVQAAGLVTRMEERRTLAGELLTIQALADCYFLIEGENPLQISPYWFEKKKAIWSNDEDCDAFFLHSAFSMMRDIQESSAISIRNYLRSQEIERALNLI